MLYIKTNKKEEIFLLMFPFRCVIIIATKLKQNNNNQKGNIIKMLPQTLLFLRYENMITQDIIKINSFENFSFNDVLLSVSDNLQSAGLSEGLGIIRKVGRRFCDEKQAQSTENTGFERLSKIYKNQRQIQSLLYEKTTKKEFKQTKYCSRFNHEVNNVFVAVKLSKKGNPYFSGVDSCKNKWICPVCRERSERRNIKKIEKCLHHAYAEAENKQMIMITYTLPHNREQSLEYLIDVFNRSLRKMKDRTAYRNLMSGVGYVKNAFIKSVETTFSYQNGWHYHQHECYMINKDIDEKAFKKQIVSLWTDSVKRSGLDISSLRDFKKYGIDIMFNCHASSYLQKTRMGTWGVDRELSRGSTKKVQKAGGYSAFELASSDNAYLQDKFIEYARATKGRVCFKIGEYFQSVLRLETDEETEARQEQESADLFFLHHILYMYVYNKDLRAYILFLTQNRGVSVVENFLKQCYERELMGIENKVFGDLFKYDLSK